MPSKLKLSFFLVGLGFGLIVVSQGCPVEQGVLSPCDASDCGLTEDATYTESVIEMVMDD